VYWERALVAIVFCEQACIFHAIWILEAWRHLYITPVETKYGLIVACKFVATTESTCMGENEVFVVFLAWFRAPLLLLRHPLELINFITETQHFRLWGEAVYDLNRASTVNAQSEGKIESKLLTGNLNFCLEWEINFLFHVRISKTLWKKKALQKFTEPQKRNNKIKINKCMY